MSPFERSRKKLLWPLLLAASTASASSGCEIALIVAATTDDDDECFDPCECWGECDPAPEPTPSPPTVTISIPDWPPLGPDGEVTVEAATTNTTLSRATFWFREQHEESFSGGTTGTVRASGADLGEGLGTLTVEVRTAGGAWTKKEVTDLLVDLSAPTAYVDDTVLRRA